MIGRIGYAVATRRRLTVWALGTAGMLSAAACGLEGTGPAGERLEVECIGMARYTPLAGFFRMQTLGVPRCVGLMSDTTWGGEIEIYGPENFGAQNGMTLQINYADEVWVARSGTIALDDVAGNYGSGTFDVMATNQDNEELRITGPIDWCDYVGEGSDACPYGFDTTELEPVTFDYGGPDWSSQDDSYATECRAVIDSATGGLQVDLQFGVWRGRNISLYQLDCEQAYMAPNNFRFQAGGVTGPGTYGPWAPIEGPSTAVLPALKMTLPTVYYGFSCFEYHKSVTTTLGDASSCEFTVTGGEAGRFSLSCTDAVRRYSGGGFDTVPFNFDAPCTVIER